MKKPQMERVQEILGGMKCPKDFKCAAAGFQNLCKAQDFGHEFYLECLEPNTQQCPFALCDDPSQNEVRFCTCPLRIYLTKKLEI